MKRTWLGARGLAVQHYNREMTFRERAAAPPKAGPIGILARLSWLAVTLFGLYSIVFEWSSKMAETELFVDDGAVNVGIYVVTGVTVFLFSDVFNIMFRRNWDNRPILALIALAVVALVVDVIVYEEVWEAPLAWLVWAADLFVYAFLAVSFVVGIALRHRGCELGALPALAASEPPRV